jgi:hypothetical protein
MVITIAGASTGGLMTRPTDAQLAQIAETQRASIVGAHTVGAPDGGPGLPGTGWSVEHGDLRVPHFVGLHALQVLPLMAWLLWRRRVDDGRRVRVMAVAGVSYGMLFLVLVWQALRGQAVVNPDALTLVVIVVWAAATAVALARHFRSRPESTDAALNWFNP